VNVDCVGGGVECALSSSRARLVVEALDRAPVLCAALRHAFNDYDDIEHHQRAEMTITRAAS
jgi:hypothetical protein